MPDPTPTPQPTPVPTPAPTSLPNVQPFEKVAVGVGGGELVATPSVLITERGDRAESTEAAKAGAMDRMATAAQQVNDKLLEALSKPVPMAERTDREAYWDALKCLVQLPFMYDDKYGRLDIARVDDTARDLVKLWKTYGVS